MADEKNIHIHNNDNVVMPEGPPAESFRTNIETRLALLEGGDSAQGLLRTYEQRLTALETSNAETVSNLLRFADQTSGSIRRLTEDNQALQARVAALEKPTT